MTESAIAALAPTIGQAAACRAVGRSRATHHRRHRRSPAVPRPPRPPRPQPRALSPAERQGLLEVLDSERFCDVAPAEVWATLIDEGTYLASVATMYRVLRAQGEVRERRLQRTHPATVKPELVATGPNQCWSWDITKLLGPVKWTYYYLYVIIDIRPSPARSSGGYDELAAVEPARSAAVSPAGGPLPRPRSGHLLGHLLPPETPVRDGPRRS